MKGVLQASHRSLKWELAPLAEADAWCVNGSRIQLLADGTVRIAPGLSSSRSIRINVQELDCPVAFSSPLAAAGFKPANVFDTSGREGLRVMLRHFEGCLSPLMVQFYLASKIVDKGLDLKSSAFHVAVKERLFAVVSLQGIGVWPIADPALLPQAVWVRRPMSADAIPNNFVRTDFSQLMWQYAMRTTRDQLPAHYRIRQLYLRRAPRLPLRLLNDESLLLVRELGHAAATMSELGQRTGMTDAQLSRHLAALYLVGAITASPHRAPTPRSVRSELTTGFGAGISNSQPSHEMTVRLTVDRDGNLSTGL